MESKDRVSDLLSNRSSGLDSKQTWTQLTSKYLRSLPQQLDEIRSVLEAADYSAIKKRAHRIKGTSGTYHLEGISKGAAQIERVADSKDAEIIIKMLQNQDQIDAWVKWVNALCVCPRICQYWYEHGINLPPVNGCSCKACEAWKKANKLHDEYRKLSGLPI